MKKILITGKNSYIGNSVQAWLEKEPDKYYVESIDMRTDEWKQADFSKFDVVFHVAGIAHVSTDPEMEDIYYKVNRDLTIETAIKAKNENVKQFIFMSSIIVYGDTKERNRVIKNDTIPKPSNFYGKSKLEAENGINILQSSDFNISIIRPPMIYGKESKGNFPKLSKSAQKIKFFPNFGNQRSMLYIGNLCEFIKLIIKEKLTGKFYPQNEEYVSTSNLVSQIADNHNNKIRLTGFFNPLIKLTLFVNIINKIFGNLVYDKSMSNYKNIDYQIFNFENSVKLTEGGNKIEKENFVPS